MCVDYVYIVYICTRLGVEAQVYNTEIPIPDPPTSLGPFSVDLRSHKGVDYQRQENVNVIIFFLFQKGLNFNVSYINKAYICR